MLSWFKRKKADPKAQLAELIGEFELPTFPAVVLQALQQLRDPETALVAIGEQIAKDPATSARLLQVANSPAYGLRRTVNSLEHAVALLGRSETEALLLANAASQALPKDPGPGFDKNDFWRTAARRATVARALAAKWHPATRSEAFTASLLQDMAVPILLSTKGPRYGELLADWRAGGQGLPELERAEFGFDHAYVAGFICEQWAFPEALIVAIGGHHDDAAEAQQIPAAVRAVSVLREGEEGGAEELIETAHSQGGLKKDEVVSLIDTAFEQADEVAQQFR